MDIPFPQFLIETGQLMEMIDDPSLRIIDCTYFISYREDHSVELTSGLAQWQKAHIPGSVFIDLQVELSDAATPIPFMMAPPAQFEQVMSTHGVDHDCNVVLYDRENSLWAARLWWMLRAVGFHRAAVLNGGWKKWEKEGRPVSTQPTTFPETSFSARPDPALITDKAQVLRSLDDPDMRRVCGLSKEHFDHAHIPSSINVGADLLIDPDHNTFIPVSEMKTLFESRGLRKTDRIITYCGGGIAGACCAFAFTMAGYENIALYDGSMEEWARDSGLPLEKT